MRAAFVSLAIVAAHLSLDNALLVKKTAVGSLASHRKQLMSASKLHLLTPSDEGFSSKSQTPFHITTMTAAKESSIAIAETKESLKDRIEVFVYITLWYILSMGYNVYNKKALNTLKLPWFVASIQMGLGLFFVIPMWLLNLRERPAKDFAELKEIFGNIKAVGLFNALTHASGVIALGAGAVSFTQVVKASEPVFTAVVAAVFLQDYLAWQTYAALVPVCAGVAIASVTELSFTWYCLATGVISNLFAALRGVYGKKQMTNNSIKSVQNLSAENYYTVLTILSFALLLPVFLVLEGGATGSLLASIGSYLKTHIFSDINGAIAKLGAVLVNTDASAGADKLRGLWYAFLSGFFYYTYNEVSFRALGKVNPVTHAIANTAKRIFIIVSSVLVFGNKITPTGVFGSGVTIAGVFIYSLCQAFYKPPKKAAAATIATKKTA